MAEKLQITDFTEKKFFRLNGKNIREAITSKIVELQTIRDALMDEIEKEVPDSVSAAVAIVAVLDPNNQTASANKLRACAHACVDALAEIQYLSSYARNLTVDSTLFYDITADDLLRYGL